MSMKFIKFFIIALVLSMCAFISTEADALVIPQGKKLSVFAIDGKQVGGDVNLHQKSGYARVAETAVKRELRKAGYKIVDASLNNKLKNQAVLSLANGNPRKVMAAVKKYSVNYIVSVSLSDNKAIVNDFGTYTATTTVMLQVVNASTAEYVYDDMFMAKALGGTPDEAVSLAVQNAAVNVCNCLTGKEAE